MMDTYETKISIDQIMESIHLEEITKHEITKSIRQFRKRKRRIQKSRLGSQNSWLLVAVEQISETYEFDFCRWFTRQMETLFPKMPNSIYKAIVAYISSTRFAANHFHPLKQIQEFSVIEGQRVVALPSVGVIAFHAPPGNLKRSLDFHGISTEWNWTIESSLFSDSETLDYIDFEPAPENSTEQLKQIRKKLGSGEGATVAILDSGVCTKSTELSGKVEWQGELSKVNGEYRLSICNEGFEPISDHGTQVASLVAGESLGIAPKAKIVSLVIPKSISPASKKKLFDHMAIFIALEEIDNDRGTIIHTRPLKEEIDVFLLPLGVSVANKMGDEFIENVQGLLIKFHQQYDINVVAAIGNKPAQVAFPASFPFVHSVGHLCQDGTRHPSSGYGMAKSADISMQPNSSVVAEKIIAMCRNGKYAEVTGSSFSAAIVAGYFAILASRNSSSDSRMTCIYNATDVSHDNIGELKLLRPDRLME